MRLVFTLLLLVASYGVAEDVVLPLCDPQGSWGQQFAVKLYAAQPPPTRYPYTSDACTRYFAGEDMLMFWTDAHKAECGSTCGTLLLAPLLNCALLGGVCIQEVLKAPLCYSPWVTRDVSGCKQVICSVL